jgi:hypothetical protein
VPPQQPGQTQSVCFGFQRQGAALQYANTSLIEILLFLVGALPPAGDGRTRGTDLDHHLLLWG